MTLAVLALRHVSSPVPRALAAPDSNPRAEYAAASEMASVPVATNGVSVLTNRFRWEQLESEDYREYAANLRGIGCPEKTIRDIIAADVEKAYGAKTAAVSLGVGFWSSGAKRAAATRVQEERQQALEKEKEALLQQLLGSDCHTSQSEHTDDLIEQAIMRFVIGPASEEALQKVFAAISKGEKLSNEITSRAKGVVLDADNDAISKVNQQAQVELKLALTPTQIEEFTARAAAMDLANRDLTYFHVTPGELRQMACIRAEVFGLNDEKPFNLFGRWSKTEDEDAKYKQRLKEFFGEKRYTEYERAQDAAYQLVVDLSAQHNLSSTAAVKIYEIKQLADAGLEGLKSDDSLPATDREGQCRQLQNSTTAAVRRVLGDAAFEEYLKQGAGRWVTNYVKM
jgi:hypothetical protein